MDPLNPTVCPKCGHTRTPADTAPAWQCPSCGIAYVKFGDAARARTGHAAATKRDSRQSFWAGGSHALMTYGFVLLVFLPLGFLAPAMPKVAAALEWLPPATIAVCAFIFWLRAYRRLRMVVDVPTSMIAAAAQGYVELRGTAEPAPGHALTGRLTAAPCVWYQYIISELKDNEWIEKERGTRGVPFILRDKTGECLVHADRAEIICNLCQQWGDGRHIFEEWSIRVGDPVHAIGHFSTGGADAKAHLDLKVAHGLASQQRDKAAFAERYDTNRDGKVDARELAVAREAARRDEERGHVRQGGVHSLGPSPDGRPFLIIGTGREKEVSTHYWLLAAVHLCIFFLSLGLLAYLMV